MLKNYKRLLNLRKFQRGGVVPGEQDLISQLPEQTLPINTLPVPEEAVRTPSSIYENLDLAKQHEGFRKKAYHDGTGKKLSHDDFIQGNIKGTATVGYGITFKPEDIIEKKLHGVYDVFDKGISEEEGEELLKSHDSLRITDTHLRKLQTSIGPSGEKAFASLGLNYPPRVKKVVNMLNQGKDPEKVAKWIENKGISLYERGKKKGFDWSGLKHRYKSIADQLRKGIEEGKTGEYPLYKDQVGEQPNLPTPTPAFQAGGITPPIEQAIAGYGDIMAQIPKQQMRDPFTTPAREPAATPTPQTTSPMADLLATYKQEQARRTEQAQKARRWSALGDVANAMIRYGTGVSAARAQEASGMRIGAPKLDLPTYDPSELMPSKSPSILDQSYKLAQIEALQAKAIKDKGGIQALSTDPESDPSEKQRQKLYKAGFRGNLSGWSEREIADNMKPLLRKIETRSQVEREKRLANKFGYQMTEDEEKDVMEYQKRATSDKRWTAAQEIKDGVARSQDALARAIKGDVTAISTLGNFLAKAYGEKGNLSEADVTRHLNDPTISGMVKAKWKKLTAAQLTPEVSRSIAGILQDMSRHSEKRIKESYLHHAKTYVRSRQGSKHPISLHKALFMINPDFTDRELQSLSKDKQTIIVRRKRDGKTMRLNKEKAQKYLKDPRFEEVTE